MANEKKKSRYGRIMTYSDRMKHLEERRFGFKAAVVIFFTFLIISMLYYVLVGEEHWLFSFLAASGLDTIGEWDDGGALQGDAQLLT